MFCVFGLTDIMTGSETPLTSVWSLGRFGLNVMFAPPFSDRYPGVLDDGPPSRRA